jgi:hypothetical protein
MPMEVKLNGPTGSFADLVADLERIEGVNICEVVRKDQKNISFGKPQIKGQFDLVDLAISFAMSIGSNLVYDVAKTKILAVARKHGFKDSEGDKRVENGDSNRDS